MNNKRRKELEKARGMIEEAKAIIEIVATEERDYYDNMPENMQSGEKGEKADAAASGLEGCDGELDNVVQAINEAMEG